MPALPAVAAFLSQGDAAVAADHGPQPALIRIATALDAQSLDAGALPAVAADHGPQLALIRIATGLDAQSLDAQSLDAQSLDAQSLDAGALPAVAADVAAPLSSPRATRPSPRIPATLQPGPEQP